jgi:hypothetical protein
VSEFLAACRVRVEDMESSCGTLLRLLGHTDLGLSAEQSAAALLRLARLAAELEEVTNELADAAPEPAIDQHP